MDRNTRVAAAYAAALAVLAAILVVILAAAAGADVTITPRQARQAGYQILSDDQVVQAVRRFVGDPAADLVVRYLSYRSPGMLFYVITDREDPGPVGCFQVDAITGWVWLMCRTGSITNRVSTVPYAPVLTLDQTQAIAEQFARDRYPPFNYGRWQRIAEKYIQHEEVYRFHWDPVVSESGALGGWSVDVDVDGISGEVIGYGGGPEGTLLGPLVPRVSLQQAIALAAPYLPYDPAVVPVNEPILRVVADEWGVQGLEWYLQHREDPPFQSPLEYAIHVDAMTGRIIGVEAHMGGTAGKRGRPVPPAPPGIRLRVGSQDGRVVWSSAQPRLEAGTLWVRAELLRAFGATVLVDRQHVEVRAGGKSLAGRDVGARYHDYGWWVPLRRVSRAVGWPVDWLPRAHEAVVHARPPALAFTGR